VQTISHKVVNHLLSYLNDGDEVDRCYAAKTLGNLKSKDATSALLEHIRDDDIDVCIDAITALGKIKEPSAIPVLLESLEKDPDGEVKLAVTESLANYQSNEAIELLLKIAQDRPEDMAFDQNDDWDSWWDLQEKAISILGEMKVTKAFPLLKNILEDDFSQDIEAIILKAMARIGGPADDYLIEQLTNKADSASQQKRQRRIATALGFSSSKNTLQALGRALLSPSADTRENVIYALGKRQANQYLKAILLSLRDPANNVKRAALQVIQELASCRNIRDEVNFNQIAQLLEEPDAELQGAIIKFFYNQEQIQPFLKQLGDKFQQLIYHQLNSDNDQVVTQTCQLSGISQDLQSIDKLLELALSEKHSEWVRKEAILSLGLITHLNNDPEQFQILLDHLKNLITHQNQTVRFSAIQALMDISNNMPAELSDELPAITIVLATLKGECFDINDNELKKTGQAQAESQENCTQCPKSSTCSDDTNFEHISNDNINTAFLENDIDSSAELIADNNQPVSTAMSTLEAIAMDNVEIARTVIPETPAQQSHDPETGPFITEELPEEMDEFVSLMRQNFTTGKRLVRRKIHTYSDARQISARLLSQNIHSNYEEMIISALAECLNDNDEQLRLEATEALALIAKKNPHIEGLTNISGKLVTLLDSNDRDMRLACIHALSWTGNPASMIHLLNSLKDEDYLIRLHAIEGLVYIENNRAGLSQKQLDNFMNLEEINHDQVITALFEALKDKNYSVSMAAISALVELQQTHAIEQFIDVALTDEGQLARPVSYLLKKLDTQKSAELLLIRLDQVTSSSYRRHIMEMLEVVITQEEEQKQAA